MGSVVDPVVLGSTTIVVVGMTVAGSTMLLKADMEIALIMGQTRALINNSFVWANVPSLTISSY